MSFPAPLVGWYLQYIPNPKWGLSSHTWSLRLSNIRSKFKPASIIPHMTFNVSRGGHPPKWQAARLILFLGEWSVKGRQESSLVSSSNLNLPRCRWSSCQLQLLSNQWLNRNYLQQHGVVLNQTYNREVMANINCTTAVSMSVQQAVASVLETYEIVVWSPTFAYLNNFHS